MDVISYVWASATPISILKIDKSIVITMLISHASCMSTLWPNGVGVSLRCQRSRVRASSRLDFFLFLYNFCMKYQINNDLFITYIDNCYCLWIKYWLSSLKQCLLFRLDSLTTTQKCRKNTYLFIKSKDFVNKSCSYYQNISSVVI